MTPKPSEAELTELEGRLYDRINRDGAGPHFLETEVLPLLARIRELERERPALLDAVRAAGQEHDRAEAAEKRVEELTAELDAWQREVDIVRRAGWQKLLELRAELAALRATPAAAVREALEKARAALTLAQECRYLSQCQECPKRCAASIRAVDKVLAWAEAGERKPLIRINAHGQRLCIRSACLALAQDEGHWTCEIHTRTWNSEVLPGPKEAL